MAEEDRQQKQSNESADLSRRQFFIKFGVTSLAIAGAGACAFALQYLSPSVLYEPSPTVNVGRPEQYAVGSVTLDLPHSIFVVRESRGFYALSAVCTHLGCLSVWKPEAGVIACPCHGSSFQKDGSVIAGPAPRPLPWLKMWMSDDGSLLVDRSRIVPAHSEAVQA